jgi:hypothetical protein
MTAMKPAEPITIERTETGPIRSFKIRSKYACPDHENHQIKGIEGIKAVQLRFKIGEKQYFHGIFRLKHFKGMYFGFPKKAGGPIRGLINEFGIARAG